MGRALGLARGALLADVQGTLSGEGLWEGTAAIALVIVVDMVAEQPARALWGERRERKMRGGKGIQIMEEGKEERRGKKGKKYLYMLRHSNSQNDYCHSHR